MKRSILLVLPLIAIASVAVEAAEQSPWAVKLRAAYLNPADNSDAFSALGINFPSDAVTVEDKWIPEFDITYSFSEKLLAELVLTTAQVHDVRLAGVGSLGSIKHLPPTLSLVYEFKNESKFVPYVTGGVNFTWFIDNDLRVANVDLKLDRVSVGAAVGAGFRYELGEKWDFDASVKWIDLNTDVKAGAARLTKVEVDPALWSLGANYRF